MIDKLPTGERVVELVGQGLRKHWLGREQRFKRVVMGLLTVPAVHSATRCWLSILTCRPTRVEHYHMKWRGGSSVLRSKEA